MSKITLNNVGSLIDATTAQATINANMATLQTAIDNTLSRDGTAPNTMSNNFDMNGHQILNLPVASDPTSPVRLQEVGNAPTYAANALASANAAAISATGASTSATNAASSATAASSSATNASTSASTATTQAGISTTQATNAGSSATAAAASATAASGSASTATTQAGNASTSATSASTSAGTATTQAGNASTSATNAAASATAAQGYVVGLSGTSTTSVAIATGSKSFTANTGKLWVAGQLVTISSNANSANYMHGSVTSYASGTGALVVNVLDTGGSGTLADWNITISGTQGATGAPGSGTIAGATLHGVGIATGATAMTSTVVMTDGQLLVGQSAADPLPKTITGDVTLTAAGATAIKNSVSLVTPVLNVATATSVNKMAITAPATSSTLAVADGKTFTSSNTITLAGTDASTLNVGVGGTLTGSSSSAVFYDNIPQNSQSAAYTLVASDAQKHIFHPGADTTARTFTIPANSSVAYPIGTAITFINQHSAGIVTIAITTDTMRLAGTGATGSRALAADGMATAIKHTATEWIISGTGLT